MRRCRHTVAIHRSHSAKSAAKHGIIFEVSSMSGDSDDSTAPVGNLTYKGPPFMIHGFGDERFPLIPPLIVYSPGSRESVCFNSNGDVDNIALALKINELIASHNALLAVLKIYEARDRKSTRLNSSHQIISYAVFCLKKKKKKLYLIANI